MRVRVLLVDDSRTSRVLLRAILEADSHAEVVGEAEDGAQAIQLVEALRPSLVVMDVQMRGMDGFTATEAIMASHPTPIVVVTADDDARSVEMGLRTLRAGALTILPKPGGPGTPGYAREAAHLRSLVRALADVRVVRRRARTSAEASPGTGLTGGARVRAHPPRDAPVAAVGVAVSTGGPVALQRFLTALPPDLAAPVLVAQHIANGFVEGLASWLRSGTGREVRVAVDGERVRPGCVYFAPDDRHLEARPHGALRVSDAPPLRGFRPSGTVLLRSLARVHGPAAAAVVLTGMGSDGLEGARTVEEAGGLVLAQDEASSVVFGMPKVVIDAGIADFVGSPQDLAYSLAPLLPKTTKWNPRRSPSDAYDPQR